VHIICHALDLFGSPVTWKLWLAVISHLSGLNILSASRVNYTWRSITLANKYLWDIFEYIHLSRICTCPACTMRAPLQLPDLRQRIRRHRQRWVPSNSPVRYRSTITSLLELFASRSGVQPFTAIIILPHRATAPFIHSLASGLIAPYLRNRLHRLELHYVDGHGAQLFVKFLALSALPALQTVRLTAIASHPTVLDCSKIVALPTSIKHLVIIDRNANWRKAARSANHTHLHSRFSSAVDLENQLVRSPRLTDLHAVLGQDFFVNRAELAPELCNILARLNHLTLEVKSRHVTQVVDMLSETNCVNCIPSIHVRACTSSRRDYDYPWHQLNVLDVLRECGPGMVALELSLHPTARDYDLWDCPPHSGQHKLGTQVILQITARALNSSIRPRLRSVIIAQPTAMRYIEPFVCRIYNLLEAAGADVEELSVPWELRWPLLHVTTEEPLKNLRVLQLDFQPDDLAADTAKIANLTNETPYARLPSLQVLQLNSCRALRDDTQFSGVASPALALVAARGVATAATGTLDNIHVDVPTSSWSNEEKIAMYSLAHSVRGIPGTSWTLS